MKRALLIGAALVALGSCGSDSKSDATTAVATTAAAPATSSGSSSSSSSTSSSPPTTKPATTTTLAQTTTTACLEHTSKYDGDKRLECINGRYVESEVTNPSVFETATTTPVPTAVGIVWRSAVDPTRVNTADGQPLASADGIISAIDQILVVPADGKGDLAADCRDEIDITSSTGATQCLYVQWSFDVADDFRVDDNSPEGGLTSGDLVTAERKQIGAPFIETAYPGTVGNTLSVQYPTGGPGSVIHWETGSNLVGWTKHSYTVPDGSGFQPVYF